MAKRFFNLERETKEFLKTSENLGISVSYKSALNDYILKQKTLGFDTSYFGNLCVKSGLMMWLDAASLTSYSGNGNTWYDISGRGNNANLIFPPAYNNIGGGSFRFNGATSYVQTVIAGMGTCTLEAVTIPYASPTVDHINSVIDCDSPFQYGTGWGNNAGFFKAIYDNEFWFTPIPMNLNQVYICAYTVTPRQLNFYVNGVLAGTLNYTQGSITTANYLIGKSNANAYYFTGEIPVVRIYNRALTATEVARNYNMVRFRYGL